MLAWPSRARVLGAFALSLLAPALALASGWPHDPARGNPVAVAPRGQCILGIVPDTKGGAAVVYCEPCTLLAVPGPLPTVNYHAAHILKGGDLDPSWPSPALALPPLTAFGCRLLSDGQGGFFMGWSDARNFVVGAYDVYVHHVRANGTLDPAWPANGRPACLAPGRQVIPFLCSDNQGGVIVAWTDRRDSVTNSNDIYATRVRANGTLDPAWPVNGRAIYAGAAGQTLSALVADKTGGAIACWSDNRNQVTTGSDIYAHHVLGNGTLDPAWPAGGLGVYVASGNQFAPSAVTDTAGGAFLAWGDVNAIDRIQHVRANGTLDPAWPSTGIRPDPSADLTFSTQLMPDGNGGVISASERTTVADPYYSVIVRHIFANGAFDPGWPASGTVLQHPGPTNNFLLLGSGFNTGPLISDGGGGAIVSAYEDLNGDFEVHDARFFSVRANGQLDPDWNPNGRRWATPPSRPLNMHFAEHGDGTFTFAWDDLRDSAATYVDVYAQRVTDDGRLGLVAPAIHNIRDVPNDQGGRATVTWYSSAYDTLQPNPVTEYGVWRELTDVAASRARASGASLVSSDAAPRVGQLRVRSNGTTESFWEYLGAAPARGIVNYALTVPTLADSTPLDKALGNYVVDVHVSPLNYVFTSDVATGYSVDNIAPASPTSLTGTYDGSGSDLSWSLNSEADLAGYRLYRGATPSFAPSPITLVYEGAEHKFRDETGPAYYKVGAIDVHGNEGGYASALSGGPVAVDDEGLPKALALVFASANPGHGEAALRLELPQASRVRVSVFDAQGRSVRRLVDGSRPAGVHALRWDGRGESGQLLGAGLYFIQVEADGRRIERRFALLR